MVRGLGEGMEVVPFIGSAEASLGFPLGCSPKRRRAAFKAASRVPADSRGVSDMVEFVDSESVIEFELISEVDEVESEVDVDADCTTDAEVSRSAG